MDDGGHEPGPGKTDHPPTTLALAVAVAGVIVGREAILERWWLWRLQSQDEATWKRATERLEKIRSKAAVPGLAERCACTGRRRPPIPREAGHPEPTMPKSNELAYGHEEIEAQDIPVYAKSDMGGRDAYAAPNCL
jgi:hypothetical protein